LELIETLQDVLDKLDDDNELDELDELDNKFKMGVMQGNVLKFISATLSRNQN
jgi:hypothetical protein